jgi:uncharacterized protein YjbJ (UPF0337 family)
MDGAAQSASRIPSNVITGGPHKPNVFSRHVMDPLQEHAMNKDQTLGRIETAKGRLKEVVGKAVGNESLEREGRIQGVAGKVQSGYGDLKEALKKPLQD